MAMKEYARNWYRTIYNLEDKDILIELLIDEMDKVSTQRTIEVDAEWISRYREVSKNCYLLQAGLVEENQQLLKENLELKKSLDMLLKERDINEDK